jgi:hypothetical protein
MSRAGHARGIENLCHKTGSLVLFVRGQLKTGVQALAQRDGNR